MADWGKIAAAPKRIPREPSRRLRSGGWRSLETTSTQPLSSSSIRVNRTVLAVNFLESWPTTCATLIRGEGTARAICGAVKSSKKRARVAAMLVSRNG
jgi:hypothetical protein